MNVFFGEFLSTLLLLAAMFIHSPFHIHSESKFWTIEHEKFCNFHFIVLHTVNEARPTLALEWWVRAFGVSFSLNSAAACLFYYRFTRARITHTTFFPPPFGRQKERQSFSLAEFLYAMKNCSSRHEAAENRGESTISRISEVFSLLCVRFPEPEL